MLGKNVLIRTFYNLNKLYVLELISTFYTIIL